MCGGKGDGHDVAATSVQINRFGAAALQRQGLVAVVCRARFGSGNGFFTSASKGKAAAADRDEHRVPALEQRLGVVVVAGDDRSDCLHGNRRLISVGGCLRE